MIFDLIFDLVLLSKIQEFHILSNKTWLKMGIIFSYSYSYYCYCYCYYCYCCCCYCCYCCCWCCLWFELIHPETTLWRPEKEILQKSIHNLKIHIQTWITFSNMFWCILLHFMEWNLDFISLQIYLSPDLFCLFRCRWEENRAVWTGLKCFLWYFFERDMIFVWRISKLIVLSKTQFLFSSPKMRISFAKSCRKVFGKTSFWCGWKWMLFFIMLSDRIVV